MTNPGQNLTSTMPKEEKKKCQGGRRWTLTLNNWTQEEYAHIVDKTSGITSQLVIGKETGESGTPHLQAAMTMTQTRTLGWLKSHVCERGHWEIAKGSWEQNLTYCTKEDKEALVVDKAPGAGKRTDLTTLYKKLKEGATMAQVMEGNPSFQHIRIAEKYLEHCGLKRPDGSRKCYWFWGPTGCGKTYDAKALDESHCIIDTEKGQKTWFCPYKNEKVLILDEVRPDTIPFSKLLTIMDETTRWVEKKGGGCWGNWDTVVVTSPLPPHAFSDGTGFAQLERRLTEIREYGPRPGVELPKPIVSQKNVLC